MSFRTAPVETSGSSKINCQSIPFNFLEFSSLRVHIPWNFPENSTHLNRGLDLPAVRGVLLGDWDGEQEAGAGVEGAVAGEEGGGLRDGAHVARRLETAPAGDGVTVQSCGKDREKTEVGAFWRLEASHARSMIYKGELIRDNFGD